MSVGHQSPQSSLPPLRLKQVNTTTWGTTGTTVTITDPYISTNSIIVTMPTGTPPAGDWAFAVTTGQVVITSSNTEASTLPFSYIVL